MKKLLFIALASLLFSSNYTVAQRQTSFVDTAVYNMLKGIAIYNSVMDPQLLQAIQSFTDSTNVNIYTVPKIQDSSLIADWVNEISELKDQSKSPPYIKFVIWFIPQKVQGQHTTYTVNIEIEPSPDLQIAADALQQIISNLNAALSGQFDPENIGTMNSAMTNALDELKGLLGGAISDITQLWQLINEVVAEISNKNQQIKSHSTDSLQMAEENYYSKNWNYMDKRKDRQIGSYNPTGYCAVESIDSDTNSIMLSMQEIDKLKSDPILNELMNSLEETSKHKFKIQVSNEVVLIIIDLLAQDNFEQFANDVIISLQQAGIDYLDYIANGQLVELKPYIKQIILEIIEDAYNQ